MVAVLFSIKCPHIILLQVLHNRTVIPSQKRASVICHLSLPPPPPLVPCVLLFPSAVCALLCRCECRTVGSSSLNSVHFDVSLADDLYHRVLLSISVSTEVEREGERERGREREGERGREAERGREKERVKERERERE